MFDVIIIGGSYAGLAAALQLARARRSVLIFDAGQRRNRFAKASHGFLGQDGQSPAAIAAKGRAEVLAYPTVTWQDAQVTEARAITGGFAVRAGNEEQQARRLILATGLVDELPPIPGLAECWGKTAFFCPYCDGYEFELGSLGILGTGEESIHYAILISQWAGRGRAKLFLNGSFEPTAEQLAELASRQIELERESIAGVRSEAEGLSVLLRDGRAAAVDGFFLMPRTRFATPFAEQLGCALDAGKLGPIYKTDEMKQTSVPGVFACGDVAFPVPSVSYAVADGVRAGTAVHQSLVFGADRS